MLDHFMVLVGCAPDQPFHGKFTLKLELASQVPHCDVVEITHLTADMYA